MDLRCVQCNKNVADKASFLVEDGDLFCSHRCLISKIKDDALNEALDLWTDPPIPKKPKTELLNRKCTFKKWSFHPVEGILRMLRPVQTEHPHDSKMLIVIELDNGELYFNQFRYSEAEIIMETDVLTNFEKWKNELTTGFCVDRDGLGLMCSSQCPVYHNGCPGWVGKDACEKNFKIWANKEVEDESNFD